MFYQSALMELNYISIMTHILKVSYESCGGAIRRTN